jgi:hypothetical protein
MPFSDSIDYVVELTPDGGAAVDVSDYLDSMDPTFTAALAEIKTIGEKFVKTLYGHRMASFSGGGTFENTLDEILWNAWSGASTSLVLTIYPQGKTAGLYHYSCGVLVPEFHPGVANQDDAVKEPFTMRSDGTISRTVNS